MCSHVVSMFVWTNCFFWTLHCGNRVFNQKTVTFFFCHTDAVLLVAVSKKWLILFGVSCLLCHNLIQSAIYFMVVLTSWWCIRVLADIHKFGHRNGFNVGAPNTSCYWSVHFLFFFFFSRTVALTFGLHLIIFCEWVQMVLPSKLISVRWLSLKHSKICQCSYAKDVSWMEENLLSFCLSASMKHLRSIINRSFGISIYGITFNLV
jgi:hypothetical protein